MFHKDVLEYLMPVELTGVEEKDREIEGEHLDQCRESSGQLLDEMFPDSMGKTLTDWERICAIVPAEGATLQARRGAVIAKLKARGGQSIAFFTALAAGMGFTVEIEEMLAGTEGAGAEGIFRWRVHVKETAVFWFRYGASHYGDRFFYAPASGGPIEGIFEELKPAHTQVIFAYD